MQHPEINKNWYEESNYLCFLCVANEQELINLSENAATLGIKFSQFREPDIENQVTAIAIQPGIHSKKLCSKLKLALK
jgi:hypothetical protein